MSAMLFGPAILAQVEALAAISERPGMLARSYLTPQHRAAGERILAWMREAGMRADFDALGNVAGRYEGLAPGAPAILSGSHMDTVVDAGKYDGIFGILAPIACVAHLHRHGRRLAFPVEVVAFGDEEGVRFGTSMMGSKALAGRFDEAVLDSADAHGVTLREALRDFGGDADAIARLARTPGAIRVFVETHIEQGPVLLDEGLPVGVVTAIAGATRVRVVLQGEEGHAGTVPMAMRRDALAAASEMVLAVESDCRAAQGEVVGTVGKLSIAAGGAINVIPGRVEFTVDMRSASDAVRRRAVREVQEACRGIAAARGVAIEWIPLLELEAAQCDAVEQESLARAIRSHGLPVRSLPSGAGHDAMQFAGRAPIAMLFVRCGNGGISHSPRESLAVEDAEVATAVLLRYLEDLR
ncbi:MAG: allantoate amidohydrolase [Usitatibacter sp.]